MKILVAVKRVVDHSVRVRPNVDATAMDIANAKMSLNPFCEIAVEAAVRLKEQGSASEVVVVSIGTAQVQEQLRSALALGADRAIWIHSELELQPLAVAKSLKAIVERENPVLILLGKQSIDGDNNQTGQLLAGLCGYAQGTFASQIVLESDFVRVTREVDSGLQVLRLKLPAIITTDLRLNQPRYPTMPNIMKARQKPLQSFTFDELNVDVKPRFHTLKVEAVIQQRKAIRVAGVDELLSILKSEVNLK